MGSTEFSIGLNDNRSSSRVLKPPGGGHSNIFSEPTEVKPRARPAYNQQNSSNLNFCMNTQDPNEKVAKISTHDVESSAPVAASVDDQSSQACEASQAQSQPQESATPAAPLPTYHHHRSTALW